MAIQKNFKEFIGLFDKNDELINLTIGDTYHPTSGYVDESILNGINKVSDILDFDYDFYGLVHFEAEIGNMKLKFDNDEFQVLGGLKYLELLKNKIIEENAYFPDRYTITITKNWKTSANKI